ncbi:SIMPL domain-containing protein [Chitinophaga caeni]|uniref:SIMPL domain-containing protein n=1 Tax=Chitinophaga caeni TaxID=2029983 RepID=A0A291QSQ1_9BACT|nr:SIMPL domain-containing protein [Chitinophaga caeni]ATL46903.1 SIMPL domain-containing protein [Chitinophaga caeni]
MKKLMLLVLAAVGLSTAVMAQTENQKPVKKIEVNGSAEMEITPDEIYVSITLREYKKKNGRKVTITTLEQQLQKAVNEAGIPKENFTIENVFGYNSDYWWRKKKDDEEFMARKQYRLKVGDLNKINAIMAKVDDDGIESVNVSSYTSSKMEEYRKEVKIKALQAAKAKAGYLLSGIGENLGGVIEVREVNTDNYSDVRPVAMYANTMARKAEAADVPDSDISFKTIKIRAEVYAVFGIK